jgi:hypothetical protein
MGPKEGSIDERQYSPWFTVGASQKVKKLTTKLIAKRSNLFVEKFMRENSAVQKKYNTAVNIQITNAGMIALTLGGNNEKKREKKLSV